MRRKLLFFAQSLLALEAITFELRECFPLLHSSTACPFWKIGLPSAYGSWFVPDSVQFLFDAFLIVLAAAGFYTIYRDSKAGGYLIGIQVLLLFLFLLFIRVIIPYE